MSAASHIKMHQDHRAWQEEIRSWQEDLQAWLSEIGQVQASLPALGQAIDAYADSLRKQSGSLDESRRHVGAHEEALADYEKGGTAQRLIGMAGEHVDQSAKQERERAAHQVLAHRHRELLARWRRLASELIPPRETTRLKG